MYPGSRKNAIEHIECAWKNGFGPLSVDCPIIIADGLKGTDDVEVPVKNGELIKFAKIGRAVMDSDFIISLAHFKGHESASIGGAIKNLGMGCASRAGKRDQHCDGKVQIDESLCRGCKKCFKECANNGLKFDEKRKKMTVTQSCVGCGRCLGACPFSSIHFGSFSAVENLGKRMAEYTQAIIQEKPHLCINIIRDVSPNCDCHCENDTPILPNIGMFVSEDPLALDKACVDMCNKAKAFETETQLTEAKKDKDFIDRNDVFLNNNKKSDYRQCFEHAQKIGLGNLDYELIFMK